jgi:hypothetical protein
VTANWNPRDHLDVEPSTTMLDQKTTEREGVLNSLKHGMETQHSQEQVDLVLIRDKMEMGALLRVPPMKRERSNQTIMGFLTTVAQGAVEKILHRNSTDELKTKHPTEEVVPIEVVVLLLCSSNV